MAKEKCGRGGWEKPQWSVVADSHVIECHSISFANFHKNFGGLDTQTSLYFIPTEIL